MKPFSLWIMVLATVLLAGCAQEEAAPYAMLDSGFPASTDARLYWLDNDRVIFVSYGPKPKSLEAAEKNPRVPSINIWDTRTNRVELYAKGSHLCYSDGHIKYMPVETVADDPNKPVKVYWREGPLNKPELKVLRFKTEEEYREWFRAHADNPHTCRWVERPGYARGRAAMPLREGDGWLVDSKPWKVNEPGEWLLYRPDGTVIQTGAPTNLHEVRWIGFAMKYFIGDYTTGQSKQDCLSYWWISPEGRVDTGCQDIRPIKRWSKGLMSAVPSPLGVLISAGKSGDYDRGTAGLYQTDKDESVRVDAGITWSPDGCKSVYVDVPGFEGMRVGGRGDARLKMTNVCASNPRR